MVEVEKNSISANLSSGFVPRLAPNSIFPSLSLKGSKQIYPYRCQHIFEINTFTYFFCKKGNREQVQAKKSLNTTHTSNTEFLNSK